MNASATIRTSYVRASMMNVRPIRLGTMPPVRELEVRPPQDFKLANFTPVNHIEHREQCQRERAGFPVPYNAEKNSVVASFMEFDEEKSFSERFRRMYTVFPLRDPTYLVAVIFAVGSLDLVINAFFDLLPRAIPESEFESEETVVVPATVLIGSILFFIAGIFDTFGALNADRGTFETIKVDSGVTTQYKPALVGSKQWSWIPSPQKFNDLLMGNLAFQAGLVILVGGIIFMFGGVTDFPGVVPEESMVFGLLVFGPQVIHGAMFFLANAMLALAEQTTWWKPNIMDPEWQGSVLNSVGGLGFMMAGFFLFQHDELASAVAAMCGSWAFLIGSLIRWYAVMDIY